MPCQVRESLAPGPNLDGNPPAGTSATGRIQMAYLQIHGNVGICRLDLSLRSLWMWLQRRSASTLLPFNTLIPNTTVSFPKVNKKLCHQADLPRTGSSPYLNSGFGELSSLSQLLSCVDVWVVGSFEGLLQLLQLLSGESGSTAALLALQRQVWFGFNIRAFVQPVTWGVKEMGDEACMLKKPQGERLLEELSSPAK